MKFIKKYRSPNFDNRNNKKIRFIIIHYTAIGNYMDALLYLKDKKNKVSSHFLICQSGKIFNLVDEKKRAWHAGASYWNGETDLNSISIGIELDFSFSKVNNEYSLKMIHSLLKLINFLKKKYKIDVNNILGHSDISPYRKIDPGKKFPWDLIYKNYKGYKKKQITINYYLIINDWFKKNNLNSNLKISIFILAYIGYDTKNITNKKTFFKKLLKSYQSHYLQSNVTGNLDNKTIQSLYSHFLYLLLK